MQLGQELVGPGGGLQPPGQVVHHVPVQELLAQPQPAGRPHQVLLVRVESEVDHKESIKTLNMKLRRLFAMIITNRQL